MIGDPQPATVDLWDPELDVQFRPAKFLTGPEPTQRAAETLVEKYRALVAQERLISGTPPSAVRAKLEKIRNGILKVAADLEGLSQTELRIIIQAAPTAAKPLTDQLIPLKWPSSDSRSAFSTDLRFKARNCDSILESIRAGQAGTAWAETVGGRGRSILHHLEVAPASWQLIHMIWRLFEDFGRPVVLPSVKAEIAEIGAYVHQLATGERDIELDATVARYVALRPEFSALGSQLRSATHKYRLENFFQLEDYVGRRMISSRPPEHIQGIAKEIQRYLNIRTQLTAGPKPQSRKPQQYS
jgi:hypothetical protein